MIEESLGIDKRYVSRILKGTLALKDRIVTTLNAMDVKQ